MKLFWRLRYGKERIQRARAYGQILQDSTCNLRSFGHNHNQQGEPIRLRMKARVDNLHPLEKRYSK